MKRHKVGVGWMCCLDAWRLLQAIYTQHYRLMDTINIVKCFFSWHDYFLRSGINKMLPFHNTYPLFIDIIYPRWYIIPRRITVSVGIVNGAFTNCVYKLCIMSVSKHINHYQTIWCFFAYNKITILFYMSDRWRYANYWPQKYVGKHVLGSLICLLYLRLWLGLDDVVLFATILTSTTVSIALTCKYSIISDIDKNIERHTTHIIVSWPNPKQWMIVHTFDWMMIIRQSIYSFNHYKGNG